MPWQRDDSLTHARPWLPRDSSSPYIVHVPHSSTRIPDDVRTHLLLDDDELAEELRLITDARTDELAVLAATQVEPGPWLFVNHLSRLVVDPERLPDLALATILET